MGAQNLFAQRRKLWQLDALLQRATWIKRIVSRSRNGDTQQRDGIRQLELGSANRKPGTPQFSLSARQFQATLLANAILHLDATSQIFHQLQVLLLVRKLFPSTEHVVKSMLDVRHNGPRNALLTEVRTETTQFCRTGTRTTLRRDLNRLICRVMLQQTRNTRSSDRPRILPPLKDLKRRIDVRTTGPNGSSSTLRSRCSATQTWTVLLRHGDGLLQRQRLGG